MSITGSWPVITRRHAVITKHLRRGGRLFCLQSSYLSAQAHCLGRLCTVQLS
ncbi:unnamed protein product [Staurois parvus]|uniref:Uncharacterized protein n=1 Tax=Staurois parvus TaxID=386267 RepID=A0ABN9F9G5_9NEOB|nr:unnamed protein product [Staurois parvus]